ncbi:hypothetical protein [Serratia sp. 14-2641]|uniref:structural cement protein Gp24 n=1 Tax=Serratia sp. 14-2641 TaxID=1841657 RepID=UPI000810005A|nr:hypothetical protein [Serratia sp. 14-2641]OCJ20013.1 hypothetical protein A6U95_15225 [Serratia sp. 14-2641]
MKFQQKVNFDYGFGVVGEVSFDGPLRAKPGILKSADQANNVFGRVFTLNDDGTVAAGGEGAFWGVLGNPKEHTFTGRIGDEGSNAFVPNGVSAAFYDMAIINMLTSEAAKVGFNLWYSTATGETVALDASVGSLAGHLQVPNAKVARLPQASADGGIIVVQLTN